ncbi:unnamed protein product [Penicillium salamii]|uniref:Molybdopterin synthase sulfur carrier subunit n=1 Tax=Penicillium salamii TaxID=1612424 RepID=A0A9W4N3Q3_9EURO|nr:unnamed protein product [Penicillium salamii]
MSSQGASTRSLHADDALNVVTDVSPPLHLSTTFRYPNDPSKLVPAADATSAPGPTSHVYSRMSAPNPTRFEMVLSSLLNGHAVSYSSGLSALHGALTLLNPRNISIGDGYHGCHGVIALFTRNTGLKKLPLDCPADSLEKGDVILLETPVNPNGTAFDIASYATKAHSRGAILIVDSTFAPPGLQEPFDFGADIIMHSGTKYFGGHSDLLSGVLATKNEEWAAQLKTDRLFIGSVMGNMESWLGVRSLRTLEVRVQRQSENATKLVSWLDACLRATNPAPGSDEAAVQAVLENIFHASLQDGGDWLKKQMPNGFGPVFAINMKEELFARNLPSLLHFFQHATSLGGVETLIEWRTMSDATVDRRLLRISVGLENWEDLRGDLLSAFKSLQTLDFGDCRVLPRCYRNSEIFFPLHTLSPSLNFAPNTIISMMSDTFTIHYFASASQFTSKNTESLPAPQKLSTLFDELEKRYPGIGSKVLSSCGISLNGEYVDIEEDVDVVIEAGGEVAVIPPVSSG